MKKALTILFCFVAAHSFAQTPRAFEQAANTAFELRDYYAAFKYYGKVLEMEPKRTDIMVRYADAARLYGSFKDAEQHYEIALNTDNSAGGKYHTALFGLALVKKSLGKYDEAIQLFERYATRPDKDPDLSKKALLEMEECEWAMEKITNPDKLVAVQPMDAMYNTGDSEMGMVRRGDTLFYSALQLVEWGDAHVPARPLSQVMMSVNGSNPVAAAFNKSNQHTALPAFSPDGKFMIVPYGTYEGETEIRCHLYLYKWEKGQWSAPTPLPNTINHAESTQTQPFITKDTDGYYTLYYSSDAPGGKGKKDLWKVRFSVVGIFAKPENLAALNTPEDEATPYFDSFTPTLYFSSTGYQSLGGYDIYKANWANNTWETPKHLPTPLNSSYNDLYYAPTDYYAATMTSNRIGAAAQGDESCCYDLFNVAFSGLRLNLTAYEAGTNNALDKVVYTLLEPQKTPNSKVAHTEKSVDYTIQREQTYRVLAAKEGYLADTILVSSLDLEPSKTEISDKLFLQPIQVDLAVKVFDQFSNAPLNGVNIVLMEQNGSVTEHLNTGIKANESGLKADYKRNYWVIATKEGFAPDTISVSAEEMSKPGVKMIKNLFLAPVTMYGLLPLAIYFDNDMPPRTPETQVKSYALTYEAYMSRRDEFIHNFTKNMPNTATQQVATERIQRFFEEDVKGGFLKLEHFAEHLDLFLDGGYEVEIMVKGFASPLASEEYNLALTRRRIVSVKNYLRAAKGGIYESYIQNNQLKISTAPLGETQAPAGLNDSEKHRHQSIFSVEASQERRAEIIEVKLSFGGQK